MKNPLLIALAVAVLPASYLLAQRRDPGRPPLAPVHSATTQDAAHRYEIVQSTLTRLVTLRVDKYSGQTDALSKGRDGRERWGPVGRLEHPGAISFKNPVNFQVFASGLAARDTFLINAHTGATWRLIEDDATGEIFWRPLE